MAFPQLAQFQRRRRQLDTLRVMLQGVDELLTFALQLAEQRELDSGEQDEAERLATRRQRLIASIGEAEQSLSSRGETTRG